MLDDIIDDMNSEKIESPLNDNRWDVLAKESFQKSNKRNHLSQDEMRSRIKEQIDLYKDTIRPFVDKVEDNVCKELILKYEDGEMPLWAIDQGFLHQLESALNLKDKIDLWHDNDPNKDAGAYYQPGKNAIIINSDPKEKVDDPLDFIEELSALAHEVFHAYQYEQQLYRDEESADRYKRLFEEYNPKDHISYCNTPIELEAYCFQDLIGRKLLDSMHDLGKNLDLRIK